MCLFWLVLGLFWVEVGGGVFILVSIGWVYFEWWWVFFGWWWVVAQFIIAHFSQLEQLVLGIETREHSSESSEVLQEPNLTKFT